MVGAGADELQVVGKNRVRVKRRAYSSSAKGIPADFSDMDVFLSKEGAGIVSNGNRILGVALAEHKKLRLCSDAKKDVARNLYVEVSEKIDRWTEYRNGMWCVATDPDHIINILDMRLARSGNTHVKKCVSFRLSMCFPAYNSATEFSCFSSSTSKRKRRRQKKMP